MSGRPKPDRDRSHLHPRMRATLLAIEADIAAQGLDFVLHEAYRGKPRQNHGYERGSSKVKWLDGGARHTYGLAVDLKGSIKGLNPWDTKSGRLDWLALGAIYQAHNCTWGGDWDNDDSTRNKWNDLVHGQLNGRSGAELKLGVLADAHCPMELEWLRFWLEEVKGTTVYVACMQRMVKRLGHDPGPVDGLWGRKTAAGLSEFAARSGLDGLESRAELLSAPVRCAILGAIDSEVQW